MLDAEVLYFIYEKLDENVELCIRLGLTLAISNVTWDQSLHDISAICAY